MGAARLYAFLGAANAFVAVAAGAFGAHALRDRLDERMREVFDTAARYHLIHAVGLLGVAWLCSRGAPAAPVAGGLMTAGIVLFSGSLYALALTGVRGLGAVTPIGGLCFLAAWAACAYAAIRAPM
jgi:uncharacterized membrane protein YgdD (TMEM256/DUF423 family)